MSDQDLLKDIWQKGGNRDKVVPPKKREDHLNQFKDSGVITKFRSTAISLIFFSLLNMLAIIITPFVISFEYNRTFLIIPAILVSTTATIGFRSLSLVGRLYVQNLSIKESIQSFINYYKGWFRVDKIGLAINFTMIGFILNLNMGNFYSGLELYKILIFIGGYSLIGVISYFVLDLSHQLQYFQILKIEDSVEVGEDLKVDQKIERFRKINRVVVVVLILSIVVGVVLAKLFS